MLENPTRPNDSTRLTTPANVEEAVLEQAVRAVLVADDWTAGQQKHLLDCLLMVRRYGREATA